MEIWATGSRAFCQLDLVPIEDASDHVCEELDDLTSYTKVFECDDIRAHTLRAGQYRVHVQTLPSGKHFVAGHQDVVLEMIEAAAIGEEEWAKNSGRYNQYTSSIDHHTHAMVRDGLLGVSGTGVVTEKSSAPMVSIAMKCRKQYVGLTYSRRINALHAFGEHQRLPRAYLAPSPFNDGIKDGLWRWTARGPWNSMIAFCYQRERRRFGSSHYLSGCRSQFISTPSGMKSQPLPPLELPAVERSQIVAGATHFAALCNGSVFTWGDPRYPAPLGRMDADTRPSDAPGTAVPGAVYDLEDLADNERVVKIAAGGYLTAALTSGGDCYVWGAPELGWSGSPEPLDFNVIDVAVGAEFVVLIAKSDDGARQLWVRGKSRHGELGLGDGVQEAEDWTEVPLKLPADTELVEVVASAMCVLVAVTTKCEASSVFARDDGHRKIG